MEGLDGILYINLDHRIERKERLLKELERLGVSPSQVHRIAGVYHPHNGTKGCLLSHIHALETAQKKGWKRVLILEDDAIFHHDDTKIHSQITTFFFQAGEEWDLFFLGGSTVQKEKAPWEGYVQIRKSWCSHAYIVNGPYIEKLLTCFREGYEKIREHIHNNQSYRFSLDHLWLPLQKKDRWYGGVEQVAFQKEGPSDIDIFAQPLNRFAQVIYIDQGGGESLVKEFERQQVDPLRIYRAEGKKGEERENHLRALEKAQEGVGMTVLVLEEGVFFSEKAERVDEKIAHFFKWRGREWDLFLLQGEGVETLESAHPDFREITKFSNLKAYAFHRSALETIYDQFKNHWGTSLLSWYTTH